MLLFVISQKMIERPQVSHVFYWSYKSAPYFSILSFIPEKWELKEEVLLKFDEPVKNFAKIGDTLITLTSRGCEVYLITYKSTNPIKISEFERCNDRTFFAYDTGGIYIGIPHEKYLEVYKFSGRKYEPFKNLSFDYEILFCDVINGNFKCYENRYKFGNISEVSPVDDSTYYVVSGRRVYVVVKGVKVYEKEFPQTPLSVSVSHGFLYVSTVRGIYCIDLGTKAEGFVEVPSIKIYAARWSFVVLVEDVDECIRVFKPVFRPPSLLYIGKGKTHLCKNY